MGHPFKYIEVENINVDALKKYSNRKISHLPKSHTLTHTMLALNMDMLMLIFHTTIGSSLV